MDKADGTFSKLKREPVLRGGEMTRVVPPGAAVGHHTGDQT